MPYQEENGPPMFTYAMMAVFIAFFAAQYQQFDLIKFASLPWRVADGELRRLVTCTFMHDSVMHIVFNTTFFFRCSTVLDNWLGPWFALLMYAVIATSSSAAQLLVSTSPLIGASGVVYGLFGFLWVMSRRRDDAADAVSRHTVETMIGWLVICAVLNAFGGNIGNTAHLYGLAIGWLVGQCFVAKKARRPLIIAATIVAWALPIGLCYRPAWNATLGQVPWVKKGYGLNAPEPVRRSWEDPARPPPPPGLFGFGRIGAR